MPKIKIKPLGDRVVIKPLMEEEKTKTGIILPETAEKEKPEQGKIIAIGEGEKIKKLGLKVGDRVLFEKYAGTDVKLENVEYKVVDKDSVLAILK